MANATVTIRRNLLGHFEVRKGGKYLCTYSNFEAAQIRKEIEESRP